MANAEDLNVLSICVEILESLDAGSAKRISDFLHSRFSNEQPKSQSAQLKKKRGRPIDATKMLNGIDLNAPSEKKENKKV